MRFELNVDSFKVTPRVSDLSLKREDFAVTSLNYQTGYEGSNEHYVCENGHVGAEPALLTEESEYSFIDGVFHTKGIVVYVCPTCKQPVALDDFN